MLTSAAARRSTSILFRVPVRRKSIIPCLRVNLSWFVGEIKDGVQATKVTKGFHTSNQHGQGFNCGLHRVGQEKRISIKQNLQTRSITTSSHESHEALSMSYVSGISSAPLLGTTIAERLDQICEQYPDREALVVPYQQFRCTFRELQEYVRQCAKALLAMGIQKGDRVGIWSRNRYEWVVVQFATAAMGCILVNINPAYRVEELKFALNKSGCKALLLPSGVSGDTTPLTPPSEFVDMLYRLAPELQEYPPGTQRVTSPLANVPSLESIILLDGNGGVDSNSAAGMITWDDFLSQGDAVQTSILLDKQQKLQFDDPINIQYTSGTTGNPKGATLSHHNILNNGHSVAHIMKLTEQDKLVVPVPMYHCFAMVVGVLSAFTSGASVLFPSESFDPEKVMAIVQQEQATALHGVPTMFISILDHPRFAEFNMTSLRTGIMAGSPCPVEVMKHVMDEIGMSDITICYGMTETSPVSFQTRIDAPFEKRVGSVGQVLPHVEAKIIESIVEEGETETRIMPVGQKGELCIRGYSVMLGYWDDEEKTKEAIDDKGWMRTGDLAVMDEEGYVNIVGRIKDVVIRGGENIYPREIEELLYEHPAIADVQVVGVPHPKYGEELVAWVQLKSDIGDHHDGSVDTVVGEEQLRSFCLERISRFKTPKYWKFVDSFPLTVTGKVRKVQMREESAKELTPLFSKTPPL